MPSIAHAPTETEIYAYVKTYSNIERLTPLRAKQILKAALGSEEPAPPPEDVRHHYVSSLPKRLQPERLTCSGLTGYRDRNVAGAHAHLA